MDTIIMKSVIVSFCVFNIISASLVKDRDVGEDIRIVNGHPIEISEVPFQVAVIVDGKLRCSGSIISKRYILTAAKCMFYIFEETRDIAIRAGSNSWSSGGVEVKVINGTHYPKFTFSSHIDYDIGVLQLSEPLNFTKDIAVAKLADKKYTVEDGDICTLSGWGYDGKTNPDKLIGVEVPTINFDLCLKIYHEASQSMVVSLSPRHICTRHPDGGHNACKGDRGAPLTHKGTLIGLVAGSGPCLLPVLGPYVPVVNTKVADYIDWIKQFLD